VVETFCVFFYFLGCSSWPDNILPSQDSDLYNDTLRINQAASKPSTSCRKQKAAHQEDVQLINIEQSRLSVEREGPNVEQDRLEIERERLKVEPDRLEIERERLKVEQYRLEIESERLKVEQDRLEIERERLKVEKDRLEIESESLKGRAR
jgi:cell division protein FtsL